MSSKPPVNSGADFSFPKKFRLSGKKEISELFNSGSFFYLKPFKVVYLLSEKSEGKCTRILISVPKSKIRKSVDRNRMSRLIREALRLNKAIFLSEEGELNLMVDQFALIILNN